jgi:hypothetical protein
MRIRALMQHAAWPLGATGSLARRGCSVAPADDLPIEHPDDLGADGAQPAPVALVTLAAPCREGDADQGPGAARSFAPWCAADAAARQLMICRSSTPMIWARTVRNLRRWRS